MSKRFKDAEKWSKGSNIRHRELVEEAKNNDDINEPEVVSDHLKARLNRRRLGTSNQQVVASCPTKC